MPSLQTISSIAGRLAAVGLVLVLAGGTWLGRHLQHQRAQVQAHELAAQRALEVRRRLDDGLAYATAVQHHAQLARLAQQLSAVEDSAIRHELQQALRPLCPLLRVERCLVLDGQGVRLAGDEAMVEPARWMAALRQPAARRAARWVALEDQAPGAPARLWLLVPLLAGDPSAAPTLAMALPSMALAWHAGPQARARVWARLGNDIVPLGRLPSDPLHPPLPRTRLEPSESPPRGPVSAGQLASLLAIDPARRAGQPAAAAAEWVEGSPLQVVAVADVAGWAGLWPVWLAVASLAGLGAGLWAIAVARAERRRAPTVSQPVLREDLAASDSSGPTAHAVGVHAEPGAAQPSTGVDPDPGAGSSRGGPAVEAAHGAGSVDPSGPLDACAVAAAPAPPGSDDRLVGPRLLGEAFEHLHSAAMVLDASGHVVEANAAFAQVVGRSRDDLLGRRPIEWAGPQGAEALERALGEVILHGQPWLGDLAIQGPDDHTHELHMTLAALSHGTGITHVVATAEDITERKRTEQELVVYRRGLEEAVVDRTRELRYALRARDESERFLRSFTDNLPNFVSYWGSDGVCHYANQNYLGMYGMTMDEMRRATMDQLLPPEFREENRVRVAAVLQGRPQQYERVRDFNGRTLHLWAQLVPDVADGMVRGFFLLATDVSSIKQAEVTLQQLNDQLVVARDRAEAANRAKSAFLANVSHEIRTPMNAIIGLTHLMQRDSRDAVDAERLGKISQAAQHLLHVINDVLDLSKIESGKLRLEQTDFSLNSVLARTCALTGEQARFKGLEMIVDVEPGLPALLRGDPTRVSQALLNLVSNAIKFTERGWVQVQVRQVDRSDDRIALRFLVRDTGIGVPRDKLDVLYSVFEQADSSTTRRFGGTGLGLAITRRLAEMMDGEVGVETPEGGGSIFWFDGRFDVAVQSAHDASARRMPDWRALVVDDLAPARSAIRQTARQFGLQADAADSVETARSMLTAAVAEGSPYRLLLVDWPLSGLASFGDAMALGAEPSAPPPRRVLMFARDDIGARGQALRAGADAVISKPVLGEDLFDALWPLIQEGWSGPAPVPMADRRTEGSARPSFRGLRVLLAEDNLINQEVAMEVLSAAGLQVQLAEDGRQAIERAREADFDLILMDVQMPHVDGLEATASIRRMPRHAQTPIVAMTANAFGDDRDECLAAGMNDHIAKPVDIRKLFDTLARWVGRSRTTPGMPGAGAAPAMAALVTSAVASAERTHGPTAVQPSVADPSLEAALPPRSPTEPKVDARLSDVVLARHPPDGSVLSGKVAGAAGPDAASRFDGIAGLNPRGTLLYVPGRDDILERVLRQFCRAHRVGMGDLGAALQKGRVADARRQVHALRGAYGAVGAHELQTHATALEVRLKQLVDEQPVPSDVHGMLAELERMQLQLVGAIESRLQPETASGLGAVERARLNEGIDRLIDLLEVGDFEAVTCHRSIATLLGAAHGDAVARTIELAIRAHDHEAAAAALRKLPRTDAPAAEAPASAPASRPAGRAQ